MFKQVEEYPEQIVERTFPVKIRDAVQTLFECGKFNQALEIIDEELRNGDYNNSDALYQLILDSREEILPQKECFYTRIAQGAYRRNQETDRRMEIFDYLDTFLNYRQEEV